MKCNNLPASGTVAILKLQNNVLTKWCADDNSPIVINCGISLKRDAVLVTWVFKLHLVAAAALSSGTRIIASSLEANVPTPHDEPYFSEGLS